MKKLPRTVTSSFLLQSKTRYFFAPSYQSITTRLGIYRSYLTLQPQLQTTRARTQQNTRTMSTKNTVMEPPPPPPVTMAGDLVESAKRAAAQQAVRDHLKSDYTHIGIGSGSTIKYVVETIAAMPKDTTSKMKFVPTGSQSRDLILDAKLPLLTIETLVLEKEYVPGQQYLNVCFDGADEVDPELNCIKGGGACHFQEKNVAVMSKRFICVAGTFFISSFLAFPCSTPDMKTQWLMQLFRPSKQTTAKRSPTC